MLLVSVIIFSVFFATSNGADNVETKPSNGFFVKNNLTVTYEKSSIVSNLKPLNNTGLLTVNDGDLIWSSLERWDNDTLQYSEIFINDRDEKADRLWKVVANTSLVITEIRVMNIGRQITVNPDVSVIRTNDETKLQLNVTIRRNEQVRIWIEIYGRNGSTLLTSSWMLISIMTMFYYMYNKN